MSLNNQVHLYAVDTSAFYDNQELYIHQKLLKLYLLRAKLKKRLVKKNVKEQWKKQLWKIKSINRIIKKLKNELIDLLNEKTDNENIIRKLRPDAIKQKNVISLFFSSTTRALNLKKDELTTDLIIVNVFFFQVFNNLVKNGFYYNNEKYIFFTASAGQIRTKKALFIKQSAYEKIKNQITCGLTIEKINELGGCNPNKYLAYLSLSNSATELWEDFDIDKAIVVDDFETDVFGTVDFIDDKTYEITQKDMNVSVPHMDGAGIMLSGPTRMARLPFVKGLLIQFPFDKFIREKCPNGKAIVKDIYGEEHDILGENIQYIFTKSQFKTAGFFNWSEYKYNFKKHKCQACYCNLEENFIPKATINYQMLQTLTDMTHKEIKKITKLSIEEITKIGIDYKTTMRLLGATKNNKNPNYMQQALQLYSELMQDVYNKEILKDCKKSLVKNAKAGKIRVNGGYRFISPDLYAFCEWLFLGVENPNGLLKDGEVYCSAYENEDELACLRSPHLYREWAIRTNVRNPEIDKWFEKTQCLYTSTKDLISKLLQFD